MLDHRKIKKWNNMKIGLVLSGGGAKGAYEAGVIEALEDLDVTDKLAIVSGTSAGALNAAAMTCGDAERVKEMWSQIGYSDVLAANEKEEPEEKQRRSIVDVVENVKETISSRKGQEKADETPFLERIRPDQGLFSQSGLEKLLRDVVDITAFDGPCRYYVCAYNTQKLTPEYFCLNDMDEGDVIAASLASAAIPYVFEPVDIGGMKYADGGINDPIYGVKNSDPTPVLPLRGMELDTIIVVHLNVGDSTDYSVLSTVPIIDIVPSRPLEPIKGTGTMNFTKGKIQTMIDRGYGDAMQLIAPKIISLLKQGA